MNKLAVVGQTPFGGPGTDPQQTPTPLEGQAKPGPLQVYETDRPFFGSTPVGGLDIMTSEQDIIPQHEPSVVVVVIILSLPLSSSSSSPLSSSSSPSASWGDPVLPSQLAPNLWFSFKPRVTQGLP